MMPPPRSQSSSVSPLMLQHSCLSRLLHLLLLTWGLLLVEVVEAQDCPNECSCFGSFVSCYQFTDYTLRTLPTRANTLVLNGGDIHSFPPGFARQFPQLSLLDIQSTRIEQVLEGTFSGLKGMDQLALTDCQIGTIETAAFQDISAVSQILFSGSEIGTIRSGAFSGLTNIGEFNLWSTHMGNVESGAFTDFSDFDSFAFYLNNVTTLSQDVFVDVENIGKIDVYMNKFFHAKGAAMMPLQAATNDMNMYSNTFPCACSVARDFNAPLLRPYLVSQKCLQDGQVFRLSEVDVEEICSQSSSPSPTTSTTTRMTSSTTSSSSTSQVVTVSFNTTTPTKVTQGAHNNKTSSRPQEGGNEPKSTSPTPGFRSTSSVTGVTSAGGGSTEKEATTQRTTTQTERGQNGGQSEDSFNSSGAPECLGLGRTMVAVVPVMISLWGLTQGFFASA